MDLYFDYSRSEKYIDVLDDLILNYNSTYHRTIDTEPIKIFKGEAGNGQKIHYITLMLNIGDTVRRSIKKGTFDKGSDKYSNDLYTIAVIHRNSYSIRNKSGRVLKRRYMPYELKKIDVEKVINNKEDYKKGTRSIAKKRRRQKREPAFNDKYTHKVDDYGNVTQTRRHLIPTMSKRISKSIDRLNL